MKNISLKIGTRKSRLALWQAGTVAAMLEKNGIKTDIVTIETKGDRTLDLPLSALGTKGVFTAEIESLLKNEEIDIAVHSAKDMPSELPEPFEIAAFTRREKSQDVLISENPLFDIDTTDTTAIIGTSAVRRTSLLRHYYPHIETTEVRGNLQTRIKKMKSGNCDALMLAYAGVKRMGYAHMIVKTFPEDEFIPPAGQGALAIEVLSTMPADKKNQIKRILNDPETESCLRAERSYLKALKGGCSIPVFAKASVEDGKLNMKAGLISLDGNTVIKISGEDFTTNAEKIGIEVAEKVLRSGGKQLLQDIREQLL